MPHHEFKSIENFVQFCMDDRREEFTHEELAELNFTTHKRRQDIRAELEGYGLRLAVRRPEKACRGFNTSSHDRWSGPGSCPTGACSGWEVIFGFASKDGVVP
jgi:hypothetical protein